MSPGLRLAALLLLAFCAHRASGADEVTPAQQSRMADVAVRVMPIGRIMEMAAPMTPVTRRRYSSGSLGSPASASHSRPLIHQRRRSS